MMLKNFIPVSSSIFLATLHQVASQTDRAVCQPEDSWCHAALSNLLNSQQNPRARTTKILQELVTDTTVTELLTNAKSTTQTPRFGMQLDIHLVKDYGCWCYGPPSEYGQPSWYPGFGNGKARDLHDENCQHHHAGFECIRMDAKVENKICEPTETTYDLTVSQSVNYGTIFLECADSIADDWCKRRTCLVDLRRLARYWKLTKDRVYPDYSAWGHRNLDNSINFDAIQECKVEGRRAPGNKDIQKQCCGDYPYRSLYYTDVDSSNSDINGNRQARCCLYEDLDVSNTYGFQIMIGQIYNKNTHTCSDQHGVERL